MIYNAMYTFLKYGTYTIYEGDMTVLTEENYKNHDIDMDTTSIQINKDNVHNNKSNKINNQISNSKELYIDEGIYGNKISVKKSLKNITDKNLIVKQNNSGVQMRSFEEEQMMERGARIYEYGDENFKKKNQINDNHFDNNKYNNDNINLNEKSSLIDKNNSYPLETESDDDNNGHYLYVRKLNQKFHARKNNLNKKCCSHNHETGESHNNHFGKDDKSEFEATNLIRPDDR